MILITSSAKDLFTIDWIVVVWKNDEFCLLISSIGLASECSQTVMMITKKWHKICGLRWRNRNWPRQPASVWSFWICAFSWVTCTVELLRDALKALSSWACGRTVGSLWCRAVVATDQCHTWWFVWLLCGHTFRTNSTLEYLSFFRNDRQTDRCLLIAKIFTFIGSPQPFHAVSFECHTS